MMNDLVPIETVYQPDWMPREKMPPGRVNELAPALPTTPYSLEAERDLNGQPESNRAKSGLSPC